MQIFWYQDELVTEVNKLRIVLETYKKDGNKIDLTNDDQFETEFPFLHKLCSPANVKTKLNFLTHLPFIHFSYSLKMFIVMNIHSKLKVMKMLFRSLLRMKMMKIRSKV